MVAARTPVSSMPIPSNSFFQKTRSLFESASQSPSPPAPTRPPSSLFTVDKCSPSPPRRNPSRPTSLILSSAGYDDLIPKSLDGYGIPPSPVFTIPAAGTPTKERRLSYERRGEEPVRQINTPFFLWIDSRSSWFGWA